MPAIAALLESRGALAALRRTVPRGGPRVITCRSAVSLERILATRLVDALVLTPHHGTLAGLQRLRSRFPELPIIAFGPFRPDDGELVLACQRERVAALLVEGVDDAAASDLIARYSLTAERRRALADGPRVLRLTEPLQLTVWNMLIDQVDQPVRTGEIARRLKVSREHLSRQFGAGGAPNLKRVIDLARVAGAAQLLRNPGYDIGTVVRVLSFASSSHLSGTTRRIANVRSRDLGSLGPRGVLAAFARGNTRSRVGG